MIEGVTGLQPVLPFREIWCCDFEFPSDGGLPLPLCMVAEEYYSKRQIRMWRDDLLRLSHAPMDLGPHSLFVAYVAPAELACFLALGWPLPDHVLDLAQEHKLAINIGKRSKATDQGGIGWGLTDALRMHGLTDVIQDDKPEMIQLILSKAVFTPLEADRIMNYYCYGDVAGLLALLPVMWPTLDHPRAIGFRGRYMKAVARMQHTGIPFDAPLHQQIKDTLPQCRRQLIEASDQFTQCYRDGSFKHDLFEQFLVRENLDWERTDLGQPVLQKDYIRQRADADPRLRDFHELRSTLSLFVDQKRKKPDAQLMASRDGLIRCPLWPFGTATGRNAPKASQFIFGPARWIRGFIKPAPGWAVAYLDWGQQEIALAGALSEDRNLIADYRSGDLYWAFGQSAQRIPSWATRKPEKPADAAMEVYGPVTFDDAFEAVRDACKGIVLGVQYGKGVRAIARDAGLPLTLAQALYADHKRRYAVFWKWLDDVITTVKLRDQMLRTCWGWQFIVTPQTTDRTLMNFPMQAHGACMMQAAAIVATEMGLRVCCPVHDAFLIMAPIDQIDHDVQQMKAIMLRASELVCRERTFARVDQTIVRYPDRYMDKRGRSMWEKINQQVRDALCENTEKTANMKPSTRSTPMDTKLSYRSPPPSPSRAPKRSIGTPSRPAPGLVAAG